VLPSEGRVVLAKNGSRYLARKDALHRDAAQAFGYTPSDGDGRRLNVGRSRTRAAGVSIRRAVRVEQRTAAPSWWIESPIPHP
jgi:hypothetical protein